MKEIILTKGKTALVDDDVYEQIKHLKWYASEVARKGSGKFYARHKYTESLNNQKTLYLHHFVMGRPEKGLVIDHINGNPLDNRRENLRVTTYRRNSRNCAPSIKRDGVYFEKGCNAWLARTWIDGKRIYLGISKDKNEAMRMYKNACLQIEGREDICATAQADKGQRSKDHTKKAVSLTTRNGLCFGEPCRGRTDNLLIKSQLLYQLS